METIPKETLVSLYVREKKSVHDVALGLSCSQSKINYWLSKYRIKKRTISEAVYIKANPSGDPFAFQRPKNIEQAFLYGLGMGLYWGEGTKADKYAVRLGNTDPRLIKKFLKFLKDIFRIKEEKLRFGLQVFNDMSKEKALQFWKKELGVSGDQFMKVIETPARSIGTYRQKTRYGVLTVYFSNRKLRDTICDMLKKL